MAKFWWRAKGNERKIHWVAWDKLCIPKTESGMGFRNLILFNQALLAKQGWRLLSQPDSLVAQIFKARYHPYCTFMEAVALPDMSYAWRNILGSRNILSKGLRFQIGDGNSVSLWIDPWLPLPYSFKPYSSPMEGTFLWKVRDVIDHENHEWLYPMIIELFSAADVDIIMKIPLSNRSTQDRLAWHFDTKGRYTVKSGYHTARTTQNLTSQVFSSLGKGNIELNMWNKIWHARIPPKVRVFIWRLLRGILPTRVALSKKVPLPDLLCVFCNKHIESDVHIFKTCKALRCIWLYSNTGVIPSDMPGLSLYDWIMCCLDPSRCSNTDLFFMCLWVVWGERNKTIWDGTPFNPLFSASSATKFHDDYQKFHPPKIKNKKRPAAKWDPPPTGRLKVNFDGSFRPDSLIGGIGVIAQDEKGLCVAAFHRSIPHASSAIHMEAEACRAGLHIAIHQGWDDFILETDCAAPAAALASPEEDLSDIGSIVGDCKDYFLAFTSINVRQVFREANRVAHRLAHVVF